MKRWLKYYPYMLLLVLLGVVVYALKWERGELPGEKAKKLSGLLDFKADQVNRIRLLGEQGPITLEKKDGSWSVVEPLRASADQEAVKRLLEDWQDRASSRVIPGDQVDDWGRFGLKEPKYSLVLTEEDGTEATLLIGDKTPDNAYFARVKGKDALLKFPSFFVEDNILRKKLEDLRDKTLVAFETGDVERLVLQRGAATCELARVSGKWELVKPSSLPADQNEVDAILTGLHDLKIDEFVADRPADLKAYGLDVPQASILLALGAKGTQRLLLGTIKEGPPPPSASPSAPPPSASSKVYVKREAEPAVFLVDKKLLDYAAKTVRDLRRKLVWDLDRDKVERIVYARGHQEVELKKKAAAQAEEGSGWDLVRPRAIAADRQRVDDLLYALRDLNALDFIDNVTDGRPYQLDRPQATVQVWQVGQQEPQTLSFGKIAGDGSGVFAQVQGISTVYKVRSSILDDLVTDVSRLRDLLALKLDRQQVERLILVGKGQTIELRRTGEVDWQVTKPEKFSADTAKVGDILYRLEELRGDAVVTDQAQDLTPYGLNQPQATVTIEFKRNAKRKPAVVLVGKKDAQTGKVYFQIKGTSVVYLKEATLLDDLAPQLDDLRKKATPPPPQGF